MLPGQRTNRATEYAEIPSVRDSPSAITSKIARPTAGACCVLCLENPCASTNRGRSGPGLRICLWSGDVSCIPPIGVLMDGSTQRNHGALHRSCPPDPSIGPGLRRSTRHLGSGRGGSGSLIMNAYAITGIHDDQRRRAPTRPLLGLAITVAWPRPASVAGESLPSQTAITEPDPTGERELTMPKPTVERTVHFFVADAGTTKSGRPLTLDPTPALNAIDALPFEDAPLGRYERDSDGNVLCLFITPSRGDSVQFCRVRRTDLPLVERAGRLSELPIAPNAGISEAIYVRFFPGNIVGSVYNHYGPRVSTLGVYLHTISHRAIAPVTFRPLLNAEATKHLDTLSDLRILEFDIRRSYTRIVRDADASLGAAFASISELFDSPKTISLVTKTQHQGARELLARLYGPLRRILQRPDMRENVVLLRARGKRTDTGRVGTVDFLGDRLVSTQEIVRMSARSRSLRPKSAFAAIDRAYWSLKDELELAASVSI